MSDNLFQSGIRPAVDDYLLKQAAEVRDYGEFWSASSAGYCMRRNIFTRLRVPPTSEPDPRKQRVFTVGHVFHKFMQDITKDSGLSIAQEVELQDEKLMVRGHFDDLILINDNLILYDYKSQSSKSFTYLKNKDSGMSWYHRQQLATYMYMLRNNNHSFISGAGPFVNTKLQEARILKISKDDLRMHEEQLMWSPALEKEVYEYWSTLNGYWDKKQLPDCTCANYEGGFLAREAYNDWFYAGEPCSLKWYNKAVAEGLVKEW